MSSAANLFDSSFGPRHILSSRYFATNDDDVLAAWDWCDPSLSEDDSVNTCNDWPRFQINVIEVMQVSDNVTRLDPRSTFEHRFVMSVEWCDRKAGSIDHFQFALRSRLVVCDWFDVAL